MSLLLDYLLIPIIGFCKQQQAKPPNEENSIINSQLSLIKNNINQAFFISATSKTRFQC